ncbi:MAG: hypothetical protein KJO79_08835 [Verrucomicrobiae bacterium]|nr:hypothetical protein [Verrucomicrobiae bacterium]NNJ87273.1 hypothetical protein [Akkermansiaceae bacterium]
MEQQAFLQAGLQDFLQQQPLLHSALQHFLAQHAFGQSAGWAPPVAAQELRAIAEMASMDIIDRFWITFLIF